MSAPDGDKTQLFKALELKCAFLAGLSIIGRPSIDMLIEELEKKGIDLDNNDRSYSLADLEQVLDILFGNDATPLMMERIIVQLGQKNSDK